MMLADGTSNWHVFTAIAFLAALAQPAGVDVVFNINYRGS